MTVWSSKASLSTHQHLKGEHWMSTNFYAKDWKEQLHRAIEGVRGDKESSFLQIVCKLTASTCALAVAPGLTPHSLPPPSPSHPSCAVNPRTSILQSWKGLGPRPANPASDCCQTAILVTEA